MPSRHLRLTSDVPAEIADGLAQLRTALEVPDDFAPEVLAEAAQRAAAGPLELSGRVDLTGIEFVTIDPVGSMDLDQALFIEPGGDGYRVWYAIADVAAWVAPGGAIDAEARRRGQTFYAPNQRVPLHPSQISEDAASLFADGKDRPALVWRVELDATGAQTSATVQRATVRSRARLDYVGVQKMLDEGNAPQWLQLLEKVGTLRKQQEVARGGVSLNLPEQEISTDGGQWTTHFRAPLPVEDHNAQISLLTGMAAATMMLEAGVGIVRTLPAADDRSVAKLRRTAASLGIDWPTTMGYPDFVRSLDVSKPTHLAMMNSCTSLFRGAAYTVVTPDTKADDVKHNALAANYAHTTAPLRRLVDRFVGEVCVHLCDGTPIPQWVLDALPLLPDLMRDSDSRAKRFERGVVGLVEALVMSGHVGQEFTGTVVDLDDKTGQGTVHIPDPATEERVTGDGLQLGQSVQVRVAGVDLVKGRVDLQVE